MKSSWQKKKKKKKKNKKKTEVLITVDNFIAIVILKAVLVRKTKMAISIKKDFFLNNSLIIKDRNL